MWRSLMKQGLKNSFNKNYLWVTIARTNFVAHDSDINLFVYFSYNLLFMRKRFTFFVTKRCCWCAVISHRAISIAMTSINFSVKLDWLAKLLHGNHQGSNTDIWSKWKLRGRIFNSLLMQTFQPIRTANMYLILRFIY